MLGNEGNGSRQRTVRDLFNESPPHKNTNKRKQNRKENNRLRREALKDTIEVNGNVKDKEVEPKQPHNLITAARKKGEKKDKKSDAHHIIKDEKLEPRLGYEIISDLKVSKGTQWLIKDFCQDGEYMIIDVFYVAKKELRFLIYYSGDIQYLGKGKLQDSGKLKGLGGFVYLNCKRSFEFKNLKGDSVKVYLKAILSKERSAFISIQYLKKYKTYCLEEVDKRYLKKNDGLFVGVPKWTFASIDLSEIKFTEGNSLITVLRQQDGEFLAEEMDHVERGRRPFIPVDEDSAVIYDIETNKVTMYEYSEEGDFQPKREWIAEQSVVVQSGLVTCIEFIFFVLGDNGQIKKMGVAHYESELEIFKYFADEFSKDEKIYCVIKGGDSDRSKVEKEVEEIKSIYFNKHNIQVSLVDIGSIFDVGSRNVIVEGETGNIWTRYEDVSGCVSLYSDEFNPVKDDVVKGTCFKNCFYRALASYAEELRITDQQLLNFLKELGEREPTEVFGQRRVIYTNHEILLALNKVFSKDAVGMILITIMVAYIGKDEHGRSIWHALQFGEYSSEDEKPFSEIISDKNIYIAGTKKIGGDFLIPAFNASINPSGLIRLTPNLNMSYVLRLVNNISDSKNMEGVGVVRQAHHNTERSRSVEPQAIPDSPGLDRIQSAALVAPSTWILNPFVFIIIQYICYLINILFCSKMVRFFHYVIGLQSVKYKEAFNKASWWGKWKLQNIRAPNEEEVVRQADRHVMNNDAAIDKAIGEHEEVWNPFARKWVPITARHKKALRKLFEYIDKQHDAVLERNLWRPKKVSQVMALKKAQSIHRWNNIFWWFRGVVAMAGWKKSKKIPDNEELLSSRDVIRKRYEKMIPGGYQERYFDGLIAMEKVVRRTGLISILYVMKAQILPLAEGGKVNFDYYWDGLVKMVTLNGKTSIYLFQKSMPSLARYMRGGPGLLGKNFHDSWTTIISLSIFLKEKANRIFCEEENLRLLASLFERHNKYVAEILGPYLYEHSTPSEVKIYLNGFINFLERNFTEGVNEEDIAPLAVVAQNYSELFRKIIATNLVSRCVQHDDWEHFPEYISRWQLQLEHLDMLFKCLLPKKPRQRDYEDENAVIDLAYDVIREGGAGDVNILDEALTLLRRSELKGSFSEVVGASVNWKIKLKIIQNCLELLMIQKALDLKFQQRNWVHMDDEQKDICNKIKSSFDDSDSKICSLINDISKEQLDVSVQRQIQRIIATEIDYLRHDFLKVLFNRELTEKEERIFKEEEVKGYLSTVIAVLVSLHDRSSQLDLEGRKKQLSFTIIKLLNVLFKAYDSKRKDPVGYARAVLQRYILLYEEDNKKAVKGLIKAGYNKKLWTKGIDFTVEIGEGLTYEKKKERIRTATFEMLEIVIQELNIKTFQQKSLTMEKAVEFDNYVLTKALYEEVLLRSAQISNNDKERLDGILQTVHSIESRAVCDVVPHIFRVTIKKDFLLEANAGVGVPGCFAPTGGSRKMPFIHAIEGNSFFVQIFTANNKQVANTVMVLAPEGVYVYKGYNGCAYDVDIAFGKALMALTEYVPAVFLDRKSAGYSYVRSYGSHIKKNQPLTKSVVLFENQHFDSGTVDKDGNLNLLLVHPLVITKQSLIDASVDLQKEIKPVANVESKIVQRDKASNCRIHLIKSNEATGFAKKIVNLQATEFTVEQCFTEFEVLESLQDKRAVNLVVEDKYGKIIGYVLSRPLSVVLASSDAQGLSIDYCGKVPLENAIYIDDIFFHPDYRGSVTLLKTMFKKMEQKLQDQKYYLIFMHARRKFHVSRFMQRVGGEVLDSFYNWDNLGEPFDLVRIKLLPWHKLAKKLIPQYRKYQFLIGFLKEQVPMRGRSLLVDDDFYEKVRQVINERTRQDLPLSKTSPIADLLIDFLEEIEWPFEVATVCNGTEEGCGIAMQSATYKDEYNKASWWGKWKLQNIRAPNEEEVVRQADRHVMNNDAAIDKAIGEHEEVWNPFARKWVPITARHKKALRKLFEYIDKQHDAVLERNLWRPKKVSQVMALKKAQSIHRWNNIFWWFRGVVAMTGKRVIKDDTNLNSEVKVDQEDLMKEYEGIVKGVAYKHFSGAKDIIDDLIQEGWMLVLRVIHEPKRWPSDCPFKIWLAWLIRMRMLTYLVRERKRTGFSLDASVNNEEKLKWKDYLEDRHAGASPVDNAILREETKSLRHSLIEKITFINKVLKPDFERYPDLVKLIFGNNDRVEKFVVKWRKLQKMYVDISPDHFCIAAAFVADAYLCTLEPWTRYLVEEHLGLHEGEHTDGDALRQYIYDKFNYPTNRLLTPYLMNKRLQEGLWQLYHRKTGLEDLATDIKVQVSWITLPRAYVIPYCYWEMLCRKYGIYGFQKAGPYWRIADRLNEQGLKNKYSESFTGSSISSGIAIAKRHLVNGQDWRHMLAIMTGLDIEKVTDDLLFTLSSYERILCSIYLGIDYFRPVSFFNNETYKQMWAAVQKLKNGKDGMDLLSDDLGIDRNELIRERFFKLTRIEFVLVLKFYGIRHQRIKNKVLLAEYLSIKFNKYIKRKQVYAILGRAHKKLLLPLEVEKSFTAGAKIIDSLPEDLGFTFGQFMQMLDLIEEKQGVDSQLLLLKEIWFALCPIERALLKNNFGFGCVPVEALNDLSDRIRSEKGAWSKRTGPSKTCMIKNRNSAFLKIREKQTGIKILSREIGISEEIIIQALRENLDTQHLFIMQATYGIEMSKVESDEQIGRKMNPCLTSTQVIGKRRSAKRKLKRILAEGINNFGDSDFYSLKSDCFARAVQSHGRLMSEDELAMFEPVLKVNVRGSPEYIEDDPQTHIPTKQHILDAMHKVSPSSDSVEKISNTIWVYEVASGRYHALLEGQFPSDGKEAVLFSSSLLSKDARVGTQKKGKGLDPSGFSSMGNGVYPEDNDEKKIVDYVKSLSIFKDQVYRLRVLRGLSFAQLSNETEKTGYRVHKDSLKDIEEGYIVDDMLRVVAAIAVSLNVSLDVFSIYKVILEYIDNVSELTLQAADVNLKMYYKQMRSRYDLVNKKKTSKPVKNKKLKDVTEKGKRIPGDIKKDIAKSVTWLSYMEKQKTSIDFDEINREGRESISFLERVKKRALRHNSERAVEQIEELVENIQSFLEEVDNERKRSKSTHRDRGYAPIFWWSIDGVVNVWQKIIRTYFSRQIAARKQKDEVKQRIDFSSLSVWNNKKQKFETLRVVSAMKIRDISLMQSIRKGMLQWIDYHEKFGCCIVEDVFTLCEFVRLPGYYYVLSEDETVEGYAHVLYLGWFWRLLPGHMPVLKYLAVAPWNRRYFLEARTYKGLGLEFLTRCMELMLSCNSKAYISEKQEHQPELLCMLKEQGINNDQGVFSVADMGVFWKKLRHKSDQTRGASKTSEEREVVALKSKIDILQGLYLMQVMFTAYQEILSEYGRDTWGFVNEAILKINNGTADKVLWQKARYVANLMPDPNYIDVEAFGEDNWLNWFDLDGVDLSDPMIGHGCIDRCWHCIRGNVFNQTAGDPLPVVIKKLLTSSSFHNITNVALQNNELFEWFDPFFNVGIASIIEFALRDASFVSTATSSNGWDLGNAQIQSEADKVTGIAVESLNLHISFHLISMGDGLDIIKGLQETKGKRIPKRILNNYVLRYVNVFETLGKHVGLISVSLVENSKIFNAATLYVLKKTFERLGWWDKDAIDFFKQFSSNKGIGFKAFRCKGKEVIFNFVEEEGQGAFFIEMLKSSESGNVLSSDEGRQVCEKEKMMLHRDYPLVERYKDSDIIVRSIDPPHRILVSISDKQRNIYSQDVLNFAELIEVIMPNEAEVFRQMGFMMRELEDYVSEDTSGMDLRVGWCDLVRKEITYAKSLLNDEGELEGGYIKTIFDGEGKIYALSTVELFIKFVKWHKELQLKCTKIKDENKIYAIQAKEMNLKRASFMSSYRIRGVLEDYQWMLHYKQIKLYLQPDLSEEVAQAQKQPNPLCLFTGKNEKIIYAAQQSGKQVPLDVIEVSEIKEVFPKIQDQEDIYGSLDRWDRWTVHEVELEALMNAAQDGVSGFLVDDTVGERFYITISSPEFNGLGRLEVECFIVVNTKDKMSYVTCWEMHKDHQGSNPRLKGVGRNSLANVVSQEMQYTSEDEMAFLLGADAEQALQKEMLEPSLLYQKSYLRNYLMLRNHRIQQEMKIIEKKPAKRSSLLLMSRYLKGWEVLTDAERYALCCELAPFDEEAEHLANRIKFRIMGFPPDEADAIAFDLFIAEHISKILIRSKEGKLEWRAPTLDELETLREFRKRLDDKFNEICLVLGEGANEGP